jgi:signal transduction histidine kinase
VCRWYGGATLTALGLAATAVAAYSERDELTVLAGVSLTFLPITTGIAVLRYRLYDLDQLISRTVTYLLVTAILVGVWAAGVLAVSTAISSRVDSALPASAATLAVAALAIPLLRRVREVVDRRFRRRRHDALATIRAWVSRPAGEAASVSVEEVLRQALREDAVQVDFWLDDRAEWVDAEGRPRGSAGLEVGRGPARIARVSGIAESPLLHEVCAAALPELEAAQLRVALQARITELSESRERLSTIAVEERRRLERDLHDGAQQRLLSVLFDLETAQRHGAPLSGAIEQTRVALAELRDLAHGLRPTALHDDGLVEAVEGLVDRCPVPTSLHLGSDIPALSEDVESAAYYVVAEALANATKHAAATAICVDLRVLDGSLVVSVKDDGRGGADPLGNGLRGLADRAEVVGGRLTISDDCGTQVQVELPCA